MVLKVSVREIVEKLEHVLWPWHPRKDDDDDDGSSMHPVLLVPGIGGSILNAVDQKGHTERVWVRLFQADHEFRSKLFLFYDPETGKTHFLDKNVTIEVTEDRFGLYSCDILDPDVAWRDDGSDESEAEDYVRGIWWKGSGHNYAFHGWACGEVIFGSPS